jgi:hypothetical protein
MEIIELKNIYTNRGVYVVGDFVVGNLYQVTNLACE